MSHSELMSRLSIVTMVSTLQRIILSQIVDSQMYIYDGLLCNGFNTALAGWYHGLFLSAIYVASFN